MKVERPWKTIAQWGKSINGVVFCLLVFAVPAMSDVIHTHDKIVEGRVLENSANVLVVETVVGEYVVVRKTTITSVEQETEAQFYYRRGRFHEDHNEMDTALRNYIQAIQYDENHEKARERIDQIRYQRRKAEWDQKLNQAQQYRSSEEYRKAISTYQNLLDDNPDDEVAQDVVQRLSDTHTELAFRFYDHTYERGAIVELARAEELNPDNAEIYYVLAKIYETDRKYEMARLNYEQALELNPEHQGAREDLNQLNERIRGTST